MSPTAASGAAVCSKLRTALIVVDVQHDFVDGTLAVTGAPDALPAIQALICAQGTAGRASPWDMVVVTRDDHPQGHVSFASTHGLPPFEAITVDANGKRITDGSPELKDLETIRQMLWPDHCVHGTHGANLVRSVQQALDELRARPHGPPVVDLPKGQVANVDFYSAFASVGYTTFTPLVRILAQANIEQLVVVGLATDYCVKSTVVDARKFGFNTVLVEDAVAGVDPSTTDTALGLMGLKGCHMTDASALLAKFSHV